MRGSAVYAVVIVRLAGGLGGLSERVVELYGVAGAERLLSFRPRGEGLLAPFFVIVGLQWLFQMNSDGTGYLAQRSVACATDRDARIADLVFTWAQILLRSLIWLVIAVMVNLDSIQTAWTLSLLLGAGMGSVLVLRWVWARVNLYSELAAVVASLAAAPLLLLATDVEWLRLASMAGLSTAAAIAVIWVTPPTDEDTLRAFYLRVRPVGFWGRTARRAGEDPRVPAPGCGAGYA